MRSRLLPSLLHTRTLICESWKARKNNVRICSRLKQVNNFSTDNKKQLSNSKNIQNSSHNQAGSSNSAYKVFDDKDAEIIFDVNEELETIDLENLRIKEEHNPYEGINLERGTSGVFEIEDLVMILQKNKAEKIFVASLPPEISYINYIVIVTGKSKRHMNVLATFVRKIYKLKKYKTDLIPKIEGEDSKQWIALDLGNITLHIFSNSARQFYDLETLWSVGSEFDDKSEDSTMDNLMNQYNAFLSDLEPIERDEMSKCASK